LHRRATKAQTKNGFYPSLDEITGSGHYLYLKAHPGEYETVRLLLGHTSLAVTVRAYCGLERSDAVRRYDSLIDTYRGPPRDEPHDR
jgi:hypothetical protein